jgi:tetratricopeptide (TPR) repeat protein
LYRLKQQLLSGSSLALKGLPGVGKTAIALELVYDLDIKNYFNGGVLWAKLGRSADVMASLLEWSAALGILQSERDERQVDLTSRERIIEALKQRIQIKINSSNKRFLLVIDDAWKSEIALTLKLAISSCVYIITTRSLSVAMDFIEEKDIINIDELSESSSLKLLKKMAGGVIETHKEQAKQLVNTVGNLPLGIVLMGRYLQKVSKAGLSNLLEKVLKDLQEAGVRLRLEQPQVSPGSNPSLGINTPLSLLAVILVSDEALDEEAKLALRALSVFPAKPNTFSEEAALKVSLTHATTLYILYDSGLLESDGSGRLMLHHTIADYARERLIDESVYTRMADFFADYVESNTDDFTSLDGEYLNIIEALEITIRKKIYSRAVRIINSFYPYLEARGLYEKAENTLSEIQHESSLSGELSGLEEVYLNLSRIRQRLGKYTQSKESLQVAINLANKCNNTDIIVYSKLNFGLLEEIQGDDKKAKKFYQEALGLAKLSKNERAINRIYGVLGLLKFKSRNYSQSKKYFKNGLKSANRIGDKKTTCGLLINLAMVELALENIEDAEEHYKSSLNIASDLKYYEYIIYVKQGMGEIAIKRGDYKQATRYYEEGLNMADRIGFYERKIELLQNFGAMLVTQSEYTKADTYFQDALSLAVRIEHFELIDHLINDLAKLTFIQSNHECAED